MSDLTPERLDKIEKAATRRQVLHTYVNGEPDGMTTATLALVKRLRELEKMTAKVRELHRPYECGEPGCIDGCLECGDESDWPCRTIQTLGDQP